MTHDIAIIVSTYERPLHLTRCLASIVAQQGVEGRFEVVVTDDGSFTALMPAAELRRIRWKARRGKAYEWLRMPMRPRLSGNNIAVWRSDLKRINGFDEQIVGWGFEDRDLLQRLEQIGVRTRSILGHTATVHLWHPSAPSFARNGAETENLRYFRRRDRPSFCRDGLMKPNDTVETIRLPKCGAAFKALHRQAA